MWTSAAVVAATLLVGVSGFTLDVGVPATADPGAQVILTTTYGLANGEYISQFTWNKDGQQIMYYSEAPEVVTEAYDIEGIAINRAEGVTPERLVLQPEGFAADGVYSLRVEVARVTDSGTSTSTYQQSRTLVVGDLNEDQIANRFRGSSRPAAADRRREAQQQTSFFSQSSSAGNVPAGQTTFISQSSSAGNVPAPGLVGGIGNRFGGNAAGAGVGAGTTGFQTAQAFPADVGAPAFGAGAAGTQAFGAGAAGTQAFGAGTGAVGTRPVAAQGFGNGAAFQGTTAGGFQSGPGLGGAFSSLQNAINQLNQAAQALNG